MANLRVETRRLLVRIASRLPYIRSLRTELQQEREEWSRQRQLLETERDELIAHCRRLGEELAAGFEREDRLLQERDALFAFVRKSNREHPAEPGPPLSRTQSILEKMRQDWDDRAHINAPYYTNSANFEWDENAYFATGEANVEQQILNDMGNICQGDDPKSMRVLEIGCGAGRITRALSRVFGEVHAVDISAKMIDRAKELLGRIPNVFLYQNNGMDLSVVPAGGFDFIYSFIVFQHIPEKEVVESYVREAHRLLKPGRLFKFQVQGCPSRGRQEFDTWLGAYYTPDEIREMANRCGFEARYMHGAGSQYFWIWLFRQR